MSITIVCACGRTLRASEKQTGKRTRCPGCQAVYVIPGGEEGTGPDDLTARTLSWAEPPPIRQAPGEGAIVADPPARRSRGQVRSVRAAPRAEGSGSSRREQKWATVYGVGFILIAAAWVALGLSLGYRSYFNIAAVLLFTLGVGLIVKSRAF